MPMLDLELQPVASRARGRCSISQAAAGVPVDRLLVATQSPPEPSFACSGPRSPPASCSGRSSRADSYASAASLVLAGRAAGSRRALPRPRRSPRRLEAGHAFARPRARARRTRAASRFAHFACARPARLARVRPGLRRVARRGGSAGTGARRASGSRASSTSRDAAVQLAPAPERESLVRAVADQCMPEAERPRRRPGRARRTRRAGPTPPSRRRRRVALEHVRDERARERRPRARTPSAGAPDRPGASRSIRVATSASTVSGSCSARRRLLRRRRAPAGRAGFRRARSMIAASSSSLTLRSPAAARTSVLRVLRRAAARAAASAPAAAASPRPPRSRRHPDAASCRRATGLVGELRSEVAQELRRRVVHPVDVLEDEQRRRVEQLAEQRCPSTPCRRARRKDGSRSSTSGVVSTSTSSGARAAAPTARARSSIAASRSERTARLCSPPPFSSTSRSERRNGRNG